MRVLLITAALMSGCEASAKGAPSKRVTAKTQCIRTDDRIAVHAIFDVAYSKSSMGPFKSRQLYSFTCRNDGTCEGQRLDLGNIDAGRPISFLDIGAMEGTEVISAVGDVFTVKWGPLRQFTIDFAKKEAVYVESNESTYGRATVKCP